jgi:hypothetical protein
MQNAIGNILHLQATQKVLILHVVHRWLGFQSDFRKVNDGVSMHQRIQWLADRILELIEGGAVEQAIQNLRTNLILCSATPAKQWVIYRFKKL